MEEVSRDHLVGVLRRAGLREVAEQAEKELPVEIELDDALNWAGRYGVTRDELISQMGGSP